MTVERIGKRYCISNYARSLDLNRVSMRLRVNVKFWRRRLTHTIIEQVRIGNDKLDEVGHCQKRLAEALQRYL